MTTLDSLNSCDTAAFVDTLRGIYEHSPWIPERAAARRPFSSLAALKRALQEAVTGAAEDEQLSLLRAHPELAGKAAIAGALTAESTGEQAASGLNRCSPDEYALLHRLNAAYNDRFGFPFILAVKGPTGQGLTRQAIIATFERRLKNRKQDEMAEALRQVHRIAEIRLNDLLGVELAFGPLIMDWSETIGAISDDEQGLTCAYMTPGHQRTAAQLAQWMKEAGMDVQVDAVGNVVGRYAAVDPGARTLITGSHYDTVRNGGKYDGRLGILLPIAIVRHLAKPMTSRW
jgi:N-carbamoyl-L-amino-acid hydrolase